MPGKEVEEEPPGWSGPLKLEDVMGPAVLIRPEATVCQAASLMLERQVDVLVVVNDWGAIRGVVTEHGLTLNPRHLRTCSIRVPHVRGRWVTTSDELEAACIAAATLTARDVMETRVLSATPDEAVGMVVERMVRGEVEYALVRQGEAILGVLSRHNLLVLIAGNAQPAQEAVLATLATATGNCVDKASRGTHRPLRLLGSLVHAWR